MSTSDRDRAVCGAGGTMGAGIAIVAARAGFQTICYDVAEEGLERARKQTDGFFAKSVERGKMKAADKDAVMGRLSRTTSLEDLAGCDLVIEAVFEDLERQARAVRQAQHRSARRTRSSHPTPPRCRSPRSPAVRDATTASSACISACRRS